MSNQNPFAEMPQESRTTYVGTFDGKFEIKVKEPQDGTITRVDKNGKTIHVFRNEILEGHLVKITTKEVEKFGTFWNLTLNRNGKLFTLSLPTEGRTTFQFIDSLINPKVKLDEPINLKIFSEVENDIKRNVLLLRQNGEIIRQVHTKDNPGQLPQPRSFTGKKNKLEWDFSDRDAYLKKVVEDTIIPKLKPVKIEESEHAPLPEETPDWAKEEELPS